MSGFQPLFIGPYDIGQQNNLKPFMLPENAFQVITNAFVFRGRVQKKYGYSLIGRLRRNLTALAGTNVTLVNGSNTLNLLTIFSLESTSQIEIGSTTTISIVIGAQTLTDNTGTGTLTIAPAGVISAATLNYATGVLTVTATAAGPLATSFTGAYYPGLPVMGLLTRERSALNSEQTIAFDTKYAYSYTGSAWVELVPSPGVGSATWTGTDSQFFWSWNYWKDSSNNSIFWVTNFSDQAGSPPSNPTDPIRYLQSPGGVDAWVNFTPFLRADSTALFSSLMIMPYKGRLIMLNTWEGASIGTATPFRQRARWSQQGDPTVQGTIALGAWTTVSSWADDVVGRGGFVDAPTSEQIVSAGFIKDQLIVYFERSTWQLFYTGNEVQPFIWQKINTELGAESTFSRVLFDDGIIAVGNVGVHQSNGSQVVRIDEKNPNIVFNILNTNQGTKRVYGIRDYYYELAYFTYPDTATQPYVTNFKYPNRVIVYNYRNQTWSYFDDHFTCYGYFQYTSDVPWSALPYDNWDSWTLAWNSGVNQQEGLSIIAGNQQGFVVQLNPGENANNETLYIKSFTALDDQFATIVSPDHNLNQGTWILVTNAIGLTNVNNTMCQVTTVIDSNTITVVFPVAGISGTYLGNGVMTIPSNFTLQTKQFNPFWSTGRRFRLQRVKYLLDVTEDGEISSDIYVDMNTSISMTDTTSGVVPGDGNTIYTKPEPDIPFQALQDQAWHNQYPIVEGETFQFKLSLSDEQMSTVDNGRPIIADSDVVLHGMICWFFPAGEFR